MSAEGSGVSRWTPLLRQRRVRIGLAVLALLVVVRVALPVVLRRVIVSQTNAAITGRIDVGDVDLWLLLGGVALKDVALRADGAGPADPPIVAFHQFYVRVGWLPFLRRTVRVKEIALDGITVSADRLKDGAIPLPGPRPPPAGEAPPAPKPAPGTSKPWNIVVDRASVREGRFRLRDHVVEPPEDLALGLHDVTLRGIAFQYGPGAEPGRGSIEAAFGDGKVRIESTVTTRADGFALDAKVDVTNLPLDRAHVHAPQLGWSGLTGRLDAHVALRAEPGATPVAGGTVALRDLRIDVPEREGPALAWRRLDVDVDTIDLAARKAIVTRVALDGAQVLVEPRAAVPLPLLPPRHEAPAQAEPAAEPAAPSAPWTWRVSTVEVTDTNATVVLEPPPLQLGVVKADVTGLSSEAGSQAHVALQLREGDGTVTVDGTVGLDPLAARIDLGIDGLALTRLVAAAGAVPVLVPGGVLGARLSIDAQKDPLVVSGQIGLADLSVTPREGTDFALGWKSLDVGIREVRVPGVLPGAHAAGEPLLADIETLRLVAPKVALTRTAEGLVLPTSGGAAQNAPAPAAPPPEPAAAPAAAAAPSPAAPAPSGGGPKLTLGRLEIENGQVAVEDRSVKPFYRGQVGAIAVKATGLHYPENVFDDFSFAAQAPGNAPVSLRATRKGATVQVTASEKRLPLAQFNAYMTSSGYSVARGTASFSSDVRWGTDRYESRNQITLDGLALAGASGDSLFAQRFGISLSLALALMRDMNGQIALTVPVSGDRAGGTRVDVASVAAQALERALIGAVTSPLKLLGAVTSEGGKVSAAPEPIEFAPGGTTVAEASRARVDQMASLLASAPALKLELAGSAGAADVRALQEAAVLADLQAKKGALQALQGLPSRGTRNAVRDALAAGKQDSLDEGQRAMLEKLVAEKSVDDPALHALAESRAAALKKLLVERYGVGADRLTVGQAAVDRAGGAANVRVSFAGA